MTAAPYSRAALRKYREERDAHGEPEHPTALLADVPPAAPMDDAVLTVWNGERFVAWEKWVATRPIEVEPNAVKPALPNDARSVTAECGGTRIWLARDGDRWLMFAGTRKNRRGDFASPFLEHAIRTAEQWYGTPVGGWQVEET